MVVYDRLVSPAVLSLMPENAEKDQCEQEASHHLVPQEQDQPSFAEQGSGGQTCGTPGGEGTRSYSAGGGEELELLTEHGVSFEEVPGITSAIAVPAYGGIR